MKRSFLLIAATALLFVMGGSGQNTPKKSALDKPTLEAYLRHLWVLDPQMSMTIADPQPSELPGFQDVKVKIAMGPQSQEVALMVSKDGAKVLQASVWDINSNPFKKDIDKLKTQFEPSIGTPGATVVIVAFSDFQCPYCKQFHDSIYPAIKKQYVDAGIVRMAYLNLPLSSIHMNAEPAAEAAMCAAAQDKFWPMHDRLFDTQDRWKNDPKPARLMDSLAVAVGADGATWRACMAGGLMKRIVSGDRARAAASGARSTPTFFIGDERFAGLAPSATETIGAFKRAIERERAKKAGRPTP